MPLAILATADQQNARLLAVSPGKRWYALWVLTAVYLLNVADRFVVSTLIEPIKADLHLSDASVAFLTGVALAIFYVTAGLPIAVYADRNNRRNVVAAALALWSVMTAACGLAQSYWQLLLARMGVGVGEAGGTAPSTSMISDIFPWNERALALTIFAAGSSLGSMLGASGGYVSDAFGWRTVFLFFGIPGILMALVVRFTISEPSRGGLDAQKSKSQVGLFDTLALIWRLPAARNCLIGILLFALWGYGLMWWTPSFIVRSHGLSVGNAGGTLIPIHGIGGTVALLFTSWIMSKIGRRDPRYTSWFIAAVLVLGTIPSIVAYTTHSWLLCRIMLWIFIPSVYAAVGPFFSLIQNLSPASSRTQAAAIALFTANIGNSLIAPQGVGILSDLLAARHGHESLRLALIPLACVGFLAAYQFWAVSRTVVADMRTVGVLGNG
jgi:predicted MFS family arabinose efflux permease